MIAKLVLASIATAAISSATMVSFTGPTTPTGVPCSVSDPQCVIGGQPYAIYGAQLTTPSAGNPLWTLTIETNYPAAITGNVIPPAQWGVDLQDYSIADVLISWQGHDYGIVLAQHIKAGNPVDSYVAGNLYLAPNVSPDFVPSGTNNTLGVPGILPDSSRPNAPIWLAAGGTLLGTGTITVVNNGNGTPAQYTITDTFSAPADFLGADTFSIMLSSQACANGLIVATGSIPEPSTLFLFPAGLLLLSVLARKSRRSRQAS